MYHFIGSWKKKQYWFFLKDNFTDKAQESWNILEYMKFNFQYCSILVKNLENCCWFHGRLSMINSTNALSFHPSFCPSVANICQCTFLSNHASQPLQTWYGASARGPTRGLPNSRQPFIYFLFFDFVYFPTLHSWSSAKFSIWPDRKLFGEIFVDWTKFVYIEV